MDPISKRVVLLFVYLINIKNEKKINILKILDKPSNSNLTLHFSFLHFPQNIEMENNYFL